MQRRSRIETYLKVLLCTSVATVLCTYDMAAGDEREDMHSAQERLAVELAEPSLTSAIDAPIIQFTLQSSVTERTALARIAWQRADWLLDLKLSGPLSHSASRTKLADLDGLRNSTTLDVGVALVRWHPQGDPVEERKICEEYKSTLSSKDAAQFGCTLKDFPPGSEYRRRFARAIDWGTPVTLKLGYRIGREDYQYVDRSSLAFGSATHHNYSISGAAGVLTDAAGLVAFVYRYEEGFRGGEQTQLCEPLGSTGALRCDEVQLGAPTRRHAHVLQLEVRRFVSATLGLNPRVSYEPKNRVVGLELPVYFISDPKNGLNGGVSLGWESEERKLLFSVFVGAALGLAL